MLRPGPAQTLRFRTKIPDWPTAVGNILPWRSVILALWVLASGAFAAAPDNPIPLLIDIRPPFGGQYTALGSDHNGNLIVGADGHIGIFDGLRWRHIRPERDTPADFLAKGDRIWVAGTRDIGWIQADSNDEKYHPVVRGIAGHVLDLLDAGQRFIAVTTDQVMLLTTEGDILDRIALPRPTFRWRFPWEAGWILYSKQDAFFVTSAGDRLIVSENTPIPSEVLKRDGIMNVVRQADRVLLLGAVKSYSYRDDGTLVPLDAPDWQDALSEHPFGVFCWGEDPTLFRLGSDGGLKGFDPHTLKQIWHARVTEELAGQAFCNALTTDLGVFIATSVRVYWLPSPSNARSLAGPRLEAFGVDTASDGGFWVSTIGGSWHVGPGAWAATDWHRAATWGVKETRFGLLRAQLNGFDLDEQHVWMRDGQGPVCGVVDAGDDLVLTQVQHLYRWNAQLQPTAGLDFHGAINNLASTPSGDVIVSTFSDGVYRWSKDNALKLLRRRNDIESIVASDGATPIVLWADGMLEIGDTQVRLPGDGQVVWDSVAVNGGRIIAGGQFGSGAALVSVERDSAGTWTIMPLDHPVLNTIGGVHKIAISGDRIAIAGPRGCVDIALTFFDRHPNPPKPEIAFPVAAAADQGAASARPLAGSERLKLDPGDDELLFVLKGGPEYWRHRLRFFYRLAPDSADWTEFDAAHAIALQRIGSGKHVLEIESRSLTGTARATYDLVRPLHWYAGRWAIAAYAFTLLGAATVLVAWRTRRLQLRARVLEDRVAKRTAELKQANETKDEFLASMSHEIRNPLNGVIGITTMLHDCARDERERKLTQSLRACADQLRLVLDDILDFSAIERGELMLHVTAFDPAAAIRAAVLAIDPRMENTRLHLAPEFTDGTFVEGDEGKLRQIVSNLVSNAHKYGIPPEAEVEAHYSQRRLVVTVANTGPDIPPEDQTRIFSSFERGRSSSHKHARGAGLGLTISSRFASAMGGEIKLVSADGLTRFTVSLPLPHAEPKGATVLDLTPRRTRRVLAVEDETYNRLVLGHLLTRFGCHVDWAHNGTEALDLVRSGGSYEMIFTDWMLPDMEGADLVRQIRTLLGDRTPPIIAVTAYATAEKRAEAFAAGVAEFLTKPVTDEKIEATLGATSTHTSPPWPVRAGGSEEPLRLGILLDTADPRQRIADFRTELLTRMGEIDRALGNRDGARAARAAHQLTSQVLAIHYHTFAAELRALEAAATSQDWDSAQALLRRNVTLMSALCRTLDDIAQQSSKRMTSTPPPTSDQRNPDAETKPLRIAYD